MDESGVRGYHRGSRFFLMIFGWALVLMGAMRLVMLTSPEDRPLTALGLFGYIVVSTALVVAGIAWLSVVRRRHWVEVDPVGTITISSLGFKTEIRLCEHCRLDTESLFARWNSPMIRCRRRKWSLYPLNGAPFYMGGSGPNYDLVLKAISDATRSENEDSTTPAPEADP